jgi:guanylate kinase
MHRTVQLKALYSSVSLTLAGAADAELLAAAVRDFVNIEERHTSITPVLSESLSDLVYSVVDTLKHRRVPLVKLRQSDGETFWVENNNLASNCLCLNMHEQPDRFAHTHHIAYDSFTQTPPQPLLIVENPEPVSLLMSLGVAVKNDIHRSGSAPHRLLLVTGTAASGKTELIRRLAQSMPERIVSPMLVATAPLPWCHGTDLVAASEFAVHVAAGMFVYHAEDAAAGVRWGLLKDEVKEVAAGTKGAFVVVEEHPLGVMAAKEAGVACLVVHVTLPDVDTLDQRLRLSAKSYEEQQVPPLSVLRVCFLAPRVSTSLAI